MVVVRKGADGFLVGVMLLLCAIWGMQQVAIKLAAHDIAPALQVALRSGVAAVLVGLLLAYKREWQGHLGGTWRGGMLAGVLFALEFFFIALALMHSSASHVAVFLYTAPIFSALGLHLLLPSERLNRLQWFGILLCFLGIALAFGGSGEWDASMLLGDIFGLLAGMSWGATTVVVRGSRLSDAPATLTLFYQLLVAVVLLWGYALFTGQMAVNWTPVAIGSVLLQGVVVSFFSYFAWFLLLRRYLASNMAVLSFMTPLFGVTFGVVILGEPLTLNFVCGAIMVLLGVVLVSTHAWVRKRILRQLA